MHYYLILDLDIKIFRITKIIFILTRGHLESLQGIIIMEDMMRAKLAFLIK